MVERMWGRRLRFFGTEPWRHKESKICIGLTSPAPLLPPPHPRVARAHPHRTARPPSSSEPLGLPNRLPGVVTAPHRPTCDHGQSHAIYGLSPPGAGLASKCSRTLPSPSRPQRDLPTVRSFSCPWAASSCDAPPATPPCSLDGPTRHGRRAARPGRSEGL